MNNSNFYCQRMCGDENFSIEEWNKVNKSLDLTNLSEGEKYDILFPDRLGTCEKQCFDCMANVGERRMKTKKLLTKVEA